LITLCEKCHKAIHDGKLALNLKGKRKRNLRHATQMSIIRSRLLKIYTDAIETFGYITKENRNNLDLPKEHFVDACVIASGGKKFKLNDTIYQKRRVAKGDYQRTKGVRGQLKIPDGKIQGFRKFDKVKYLGQEYFIKGRASSGYAILMNIFNDKIDFSYMSRGWKTPKLSNLERVSARSSCLCTSQRI